MLGDAVLCRGERVDHGAALEKLYMIPAPYPEGAKNACKNNNNKYVYTQKESLLLLNIPNKFEL